MGLISSASEDTHDEPSDEWVETDDDDDDIENSDDDEVAALGGDKFSLKSNLGLLALLLISLRNM